MKTFAAALAKCRNQLQNHEQKTSNPDKKALWSKLDKSSLRGVDACLTDLTLLWRETLSFYGEELDEDGTKLVLSRIGKQELPSNIYRQLSADEESLLPYTRNAILSSYVNAKWSMLDRLAQFIGIAVGDTRDDGDVSFGSVFRNDQKLMSFWRTRIMRESRELYIGGLAFSYFLRNQICHCGFTVNGVSVFDQVAPSFSELLNDKWSDSFLDTFKSDHANNSDFKFLSVVGKDAREKFLAGTGPKILDSIKQSHDSTVKFATRTIHAASALLELTDS
jgi:hypothetical protein